eukprot:gene26337-47618_t
MTDTTTDTTDTTEQPAVLTEQRGRVLLIPLNRPDQMNSINGALSHGLWDAVQQLNSDPGLTAGVLTGNGRGFCSGMDLKAFSRGEDIGPMMQFIQNGAEKPLIGAIEGFALAGGLELALSCDLLVAAKGAKLGIPEVNVGLFAAGGGLEQGPQLAAQQARPVKPETDRPPPHRRVLLLDLAHVGQHLVAADIERAESHRPVAGRLKDCLVELVLFLRARELR